MINKVFNSLIKGYFLLELYERSIFFFSYIQGQICKFFYKNIFNRRLIFGKNFKCYGNFDVRIHKNSKIKIGDNVTFVSSSKKSALSINSKLKLVCFYKGSIDIRNNVAINGSTISCRSTSIVIKEGTIIAPNCTITDSNFHSILPIKNRNTNLGIETDRPIYIEKNVWIGLNCTVLKGVRIGENSIIAAGSVVLSNVEPNSIYRGNPAVFVKKYI